MPNAKEGTLVTCDIPTMQFIIEMDQCQLPGLIIAMLDDTHVLIDGGQLRQLRTQLTKFSDANAEGKKYDIQVGTNVGKLK